MIKPVEAKPGTGMSYDTSLSPAPAPESQGESVAAPAEVGQVVGTLHHFQDYLLSQKQSLSSLPAMAEKIAAIDAALHELDLYLFGEGLA